MMIGQAIAMTNRRTGQFSVGGLSHFCPKNFSTAPDQKTAMLTYKITLLDSPHPVMPDFGHFISIDGVNSVFSFNKYNFFNFGYWFLPDKFSFCPKNNDFARVWGLQPPSPCGSYAYVLIGPIVSRLRRSLEEVAKLQSGWWVEVCVSYSSAWHFRCNHVININVWKDRLIIKLICCVFVLWESNV